MPAPTRAPTRALPRALRADPRSDVRAAPLLVLLPPSEGKASGGDGPPFAVTDGAFGAALAAGRRAVLRGVRTRVFDPAELGVSAATAAAALAVTRASVGAATLPALRRYTGVLYDALDYPHRPAALRRALDRDVVVISGLLGAVRGADPVPDYKLPIGAAVPGCGRLAAYWKPRLARALAPAADGAVVWDLLPAAHAAAWRPGPGVAAHWTVRVVREVDGRRSTVSHDNKAVKGALAAFLVAHQVRDPAALADFTGPGGYRAEPPHPTAPHQVTLVTRGSVAPPAAAR